MTRPHIVIVGAGFAGLAAARRFQGEEVDVTVVDRHNFHTFQPLLYQVATAGLNAADVAHPVRAIFQRQPNVSFRQATVTGVDWEAGRLAVALANGGDAGEVPFDHLIVAAGSATNWFGIDGAEEHGFPLYGLADAIALRNHVLGCFEAADADPALVDVGILTFVVVGGGSTGVEVAGALAELFAMVLRKDFPRLAVGQARIVVVEMVDALLPPFGERSRRHARTQLEARGVEVRLGEAVASVTPTLVRLRSGDELATHTLIWAAGIQAGALAGALGVHQAAGGRIEVGPDLAVVGHPEAYAVGDVAHLVHGMHGDDGGRPLPQLAPVAMQSGAHAAGQVLSRLAGRPTEPFRYRDKGTMATIGRRSAVAELPFGIRLRGSLAWFAWLGLHLVFLIGFRNRVSVLVNWAWNYLTWDRGPRLILRPEASESPNA